VHRCLAEQGEYGGADVAATGAMASVTALGTAAEAAAVMATPAAFEPVPAAAVGMAPGTLVVP
jgi:hypothetical protein